MKRSGFKSRGKPLTAKKPMRKVSAKRQAYRAAEKTQGSWEHMARVKSLPCLVCGILGVDVHHLPGPRSDFRVIPLCPFHHRCEYGPEAYHYSRRNFNARHGTDEQLLAKTLEMLDK